MTIYDRAIDRGLITFDTELRLICSKALKDHFAHATVAQHFKTYEGQPLTIPADPGSWTGAGPPAPNPITWRGIGRRCSGSL